jgi:hypothetical protein
MINKEKLALNNTKIMKKKKEHILYTFLYWYI